MLVSDVFRATKDQVYTKINIFNSLIKLTRLEQLWYLIVLTSLTLMAQYGLQGWLAQGELPISISDGFKLLDACLWAIRALIEAWALIYIFTTSPSNRKLVLFEISLITLIIITLGPVLASIGLQLPLRESLPKWLYWTWNYCIAAYAPLMLGAVGYAYRLQQSDTVVTKEKRVYKKRVKK